MSSEIDSNKLNMGSFLSMTEDEVLDKTVDSNVGGKVKIHARQLPKKSKDSRVLQPDPASPIVDNPPKGTPPKKEVSKPAAKPAAKPKVPPKGQKKKY